MHMQNEEKPAQRKRFDAGWYPNMSNEDYHSSSGYSSSTLKVLMDKSMAHLNYQQGIQSVPTDAKNKGSLLHAMVLEPHVVDQEFMIRPEGLARPSSRILNAANPSAASQEKIDAWLAFEAERGDRLDITQEQHDHCRRMADSLLTHPIISKWFDPGMGGLAEQSVYYWYRGEDWEEKPRYKLMMKVRPDWILPGHNVLFDLKSTRDASFTAFMKQARNLGYHISAAMYLDGVNSNKEFLDHCGVNLFTKFVWVVVENEPPYAATYYEISKKDFQEGRQVYHTLARRLDTYTKSEWKGYGSTDENGLITPDGRVSDMPRWGYPIA
jgi:exodeoxyribonuclease VIII